MTTITKIPLTAQAVKSEERELAVDSLSVRDAIIGDGLMLTQHTGGFQIHSVGRGQAELIGSFSSPGAALAALDLLDDDFS